MSDPKRWPFPPISRKFLLAIGIFLVVVAFLPFLGVMAMAAIFAFGLELPLRSLTQRFGARKRSVFVNLTMVVVAIAIIFPSLFFGFRVYNAFFGAKGGSQSVVSSSTVKNLTSAYTRVEASLARYGVTAKVFDNPEEAQANLREAATSMGNKALAVLSGAVTALPEFVLLLFVFSLFLWLFLAKAAAIKRQVLGLELMRPPELNETVRILQTCSYDVIVSNLAVGAMQASIVTAGAWFTGYREAFLIFLVTFIFSYIPVIGAAPVALALGVLSLINDDYGGAIALGVVALIAGTADNLARPYFISNSENEVHPIVILVAILGALVIFGLKGLFLGPVFVTATVAMLKGRAAAKQEKAVPLSSTASKKVKDAS